MTRVLFSAVALVAFCFNASAGETVVHLSVRPMAAPVPALRYQLLPELGELNPGNAAHNYLKCFMEQRRFFYGKEAAADRARYLAMTLAELPADQLRNYGGSALKQADWAARLDTVDWQNLRQIQTEGIGIERWEPGPLQVLAAALQVRFRGEVAGKRFDDAMRTAKTMFALSRHLGEHPSAIANSVGLWVAHLSLGTLEEMVQQSGCPNLYWALTDLPCPLVDLRKGVQGERTLIAGELRAIHDDVPMTEAEMEKFVSMLFGTLSFAREQAGKAPRSMRGALEARVKDSEKVRAARRRLIEVGCAESLVNRFPPLQVILLDDKREYEVYRDERMKLLALPLWEINRLIEEQAPQRDGLFVDLLPDIIKLRREQAELERQIALLRHVEAIRLYAAKHNGQPPASLSEVRVPLPVDPVTGKPFDFAVEGKTAHLRNSVLPGDSTAVAHNVHYEVTLQK
jgi:hypothetical protein